MSNLQRILNMAAKALDKKTQSSAGNNTGQGKTDWRDMVRTVADKVTGDTRTGNVAPGGPVVRSGASVPVRAVAPASVPAAAPALTPADAAAIARYDYLLETAHPGQLEQVHRDAFARLTPAQREQVGAQLRAELPAGEQPASTSAADLARSATRGEAQNPGFLRKLFAKPAGGKGGTLAGAGIGAVAGVGIGAAGGLLAAVAGGAVLSSVAAPLLEQAAGLGVDFESLAGGLTGGLEGLSGDLAGGLDGVTADLAGSVEGVSGDLAGGLEGVTGGLDGLASGAGEQVTGFGEQLSELGSNFEIPGLGDLGKFFGR